MDALIVRGLRGTNGDYDVDLIALTDIGSGGDALNNREQHRLKTLAGVRGGDIRSEFLALDSATMVGLAAIILARHGKTISDEILWDARFIYSDKDSVPEDDAAGPTVIFAVQDRTKLEAESEVEANPPAEAAPSASLSQIGAASSRTTSDPLASGPSPIGLPRSATPTSDRDSVPATSVN